MNRVVLKSNGVLESDGRSAGDRLLACLGHQLQLADDCTLRTFFDLIGSHGHFSEMIDFYAILRRQYDQCPAQECRWPDFDWLEFGKVVSMIGFPEEPRLEIYHTLYGVSQDDVAETRQLPLSVLLDMPLRLGKLKHRVFGDRLDLFTFETVYTLFEFIDGMAWELSFHAASDQCLARS